MVKRKRKQSEGEGADGATSTVEQTPEDAKFAEGLEVMKKQANLRDKLKRRLQTFKRTGKITPDSIRRLVADLFDALD